MSEDLPRNPYFRNRAAWVVPRTILIVDQDAAFVSKLERELLKTGARIVTADSGAAAQRLVRELRPRIVVLDLTLRDVDGYEVFRAIRTDPDTCNTVVIVTHPEPSDLDMFRAFQLYSDCFLTKPIDPPEIMPFITRILE